MSRRSPRTAWLRIGMDAWALGFEASTVIGLRAMKIAAGGPAAKAESELMVREKLQAAAALQASAMTGRLGVSPAGVATATLAQLRRKVRANQRRLTRP